MLKFIFIIVFCISISDGQIATTDPSYTVTQTDGYSTEIMPFSEIPSDNNFVRECSKNIAKIWLDIQFIVETSSAANKYVTMKDLGEALAKLIKPINVDYNMKEASRIGLITVDGVNAQPRLEMTNSSSEKIYRNFFNLETFLTNPVADLFNAVKLAHSKFVSQKSHRPRVLIYITAVHSITNPKINETIEKMKFDGINVITLSLPANTNLEYLANKGYDFNFYADSWQDQLHLALTQINCVCPFGTHQQRIYDTTTKSHKISADCYSGYPALAYPSLPQYLCYNGIFSTIPNPSTFEFIKSNILLKDLINFGVTIGLHKSADTWMWYSYDNVTSPYANYPSFTENPTIEQKYGFLQNYNGTWHLYAGDDTPKAFLCQNKACDADNFCDLSYIIYYKKFLRKYRFFL